MVLEKNRVEPHKTGPHGQHDIFMVVVITCKVEDILPLPILSGVSQFDVLPPALLIFCQILPIYHKILKTREKLLIFSIFL